MSNNFTYRPFSWVSMLILSLLFLTPTLMMLFLSGGVDILVSGLKLAGSSLSIADLDQAALGFLNMSMLKPLWEEVWIGLFGIYCAFGLKKHRGYSWNLSLGWGIMLLVNGATQGIYEVIILDWKAPCFQTFLFLGLGAAGIINLLLARIKLTPLLERK